MAQVTCPACAGPTAPGGDCILCGGLCVVTAEQADAFNAAAVLAAELNEHKLKIGEIVDAFHTKEEINSALLELIELN